MKRFLAAIGVVLLLSAGTASAADNTAVAVNTKDGSSLFVFSFNVARVMQDTVDEANAAAAVASCTECQTVALAVQFVLVMGDPSVVTPENLALAMNIECTLCDTLASAYQFVIQVDGPVRLTGDGMRRLMALRLELAKLEKSGLTGTEMQPRIDALVKEAYQVVTTSLVEVGPPDEPDSSTASTTSTEQKSTTTSTTSTTEPSTTTTSTTAASTTTTTEG